MRGHAFHQDYLDSGAANVVLARLIENVMPSVQKKPGISSGAMRRMGCWIQTKLPLPSGRIWIGIRPFPQERELLRDRDRINEGFAKLR